MRLTRYTRIQSIPDVTQSMPRAEISKQLKALFGPSDDFGHNNGPKLLFVYDVSTTKCVMRHFGVDTSRWEVGIKDLLYFPGAFTTSSHRPPRGVVVKRQQDDCGGKWERDRSRSPPHRRPNGYDGVGARPRSPPRARAPPKVYMVDIRTLHRTVMHDPQEEDTLLRTAKALGVSDQVLIEGEEDSVAEDIDLNKWCAGKESR